MKEREGKKVQKNCLLPEAYLQMVILPERILLYLRRGKDITKQLEEQLKALGLNCSIDFKSPCG